MEEAKRKAEAKTSRLEVKRTSLLLEVGEAKDEVSSLHSQAGKDKEAMEEDGQKALELIFFLWLRVLCVQTQHLGRPTIGSGWYARLLLPTVSRVSYKPRCPPGPAAIEVTTIEVEQSKAKKEPEKSALIRN